MVLDLGSIADPVDHADHVHGQLGLVWSATYGRGVRESEELFGDTIT